MRDLDLIYILLDVWRGLPGIGLRILVSLHLESSAESSLSSQL